MISISLYLQNFFKDRLNLIAIYKLGRSKSPLNKLLFSNDFLSIKGSFYHCHISIVN